MVGMGSGSSEQFERLTMKHRGRLVRTILNSKSTLAEAARTHGSTVGGIEDKGAAIGSREERGKSIYDTRWRKKTL